MVRLYHSLLLILAKATDRELARYVQFLKAQNEILRVRVPGNILVTTKERKRLVKFAAKLTSKAIGELVTIVHPETVRRWLREDRKVGRSKPAKRGRPLTSEQIRKLILKLAKENDGWGYTRIMGELKKLGIKPPSRNTVKRILIQNGFDPSPKRGDPTWDEFIKEHAATMWQCDYFSKRALTLKGIRQLFVIVFLHVETRRVFITPATCNPTEGWAKQQAQAFIRFAKSNDLEAKCLFHDHDSSFHRAFDEELRAANIEVNRVPFRSPNLNAFVERFIQTIQVEALDYFVAFGEKHFDYLCQSFLDFYHRCRPHQAKENELLIPVSSARRRKKQTKETPSLSDVRCEKFLGGRLKHYYRKAA